MAVVRGQRSEGAGLHGLEVDEVDAFYHHPERHGWSEMLFTGMASVFFLSLLAAATAGAFLYTQG